MSARATLILLGALLLSGCEDPRPASVPAQSPAAPRVSDGTQRLVGVVTRVADGDTLIVRDERNRQERVRMADIDAPELQQLAGQAALEALAEKVLDQRVTVHWRERDQYDRIAGHVFVGERFINRELVSEGHAWHNDRHSDDKTLAAAQRTARSRRLGLWQQPNPTPPWEFRRAHPRTD